MKILWITNNPIAFHRQQLDEGFSQGGGWMDAAFEELKGYPNIELGLASVYACNSLVHHKSDNISCYVVPNDIKDGLYNYKKSNNIELWKRIFDDFQPDVIHIWGSELCHALCALIAMPNVPTVVYMQGLMSQIYNHSEAGIDYLTKLRYTSIRDLLHNKGVYSIDYFERKRALIEKEIISKAGNVIVENDWCAYNCNVIKHDCRIFRSLLPIKKLFAEKTWTKDTMMPHTIFTVAGGYPIKGHHMLYKALGIVKHVYPDVKLFIPGYNPIHDDNGIRRMFPTTFTKYVRSLIKKYDLDDNIVYLGKIMPTEMADYMSKCHLFVMPSAIENHSSTLIEAMMTGAPCITSNVGGVSHYFRDGINGFMYRYDEPETLAGIILKLFDDINLCKEIGYNALNSSRNERLTVNISKDFVNIYDAIINEYNK